MNAPNNPTLVFLPGFGFDKQIWEEVTNELSDYSCLLLDLPSMTQYDSTTLDHIVHRLACLCPKNSVIIGWSLGGLIGIALSHAYPTIFSRLIMIASLPHIYYEPKNEPFSAFLSQFHRWVFYPNHTKILREKLKKYEQKNPHPAYLSLLLATNLQDIFMQLTQPILHIFAGRDAIISVENAREMAAKKALTSHEISSAGHAIFLSHPQEIAKKIREFLC